jgi:hypothetical protein
LPAHVEFLLLLIETPETLEYAFGVIESVFIKRAYELLPAPHDRLTQSSTLPSARNTMASTWSTLVSKKRKARRREDEEFLHGFQAAIENGQIKPGQFPDERVVAFIDILGFKDLVDRMFGGEPELFRLLLEALDYTKSLECPDPDRLLAVTAFSDSVVISEGGELGSAGVLASVGVLSGELLKRGILCRGAICSGRTYHAQGICFGEGLITAYELERSTAINPRIIISNEVAPTISYLIEDPIPRLKRDSDRVLFVNVFNYFWDHFQGKVDTVGLEQAREGLLTALSRAQRVDQKAVAKVNWSIQQFNHTIELFPNLGISPLPIHV